MLEKITELIVADQCAEAVEILLGMDDKSFIETFAALQANAEVKKKMMETARSHFIESESFTNKVKQAISNKDNLAGLFKKKD